MTFNPKAFLTFAGFVALLVLALNGKMWAFVAIAAALAIEGLFWAGGFGLFGRPGQAHRFRDH
jgi:threonine/homoserine/homoserine lactone efflux protein